MVNISSLTVKFGQLKVIENFDYKFIENKITVLCGPSGCGKTTLLNAIAQIVPYSGEIKRNSLMSYVFQEDRLLPWMTVYQNIEFVLKGIMEKKIYHDRIMAYLKLVNLTNYAHEYPSALSGGMKRRVSIARAFSYPSKLLLMDEPFKGLDWDLKEGIMSDFKKMWEQDKKTVLFVTHDSKEADYLGDEIIYLKGLPLEVKNG